MYEQQGNYEWGEVRKYKIQIIECYVINFVLAVEEVEVEECLGTNRKWR